MPTAKYKLHYITQTYLNLTFIVYNVLSSIFILATIKMSTIPIAHCKLHFSNKSNLINLSSNYNTNSCVGLSGRLQNFQFFGDAVDILTFGNVAVDIKT
jgi:hypothetical protein